MRKKNREDSSKRVAGGYENLPVNSEFYSGAPTEAPLIEDRSETESRRVRKTGRHQAVAGRRKETIDPREKMALLAILKSAVMILLLVIAFFMLRKGINLYEESIWIDNQTVAETSPVLREVVMVEDFDIQDQKAREQFAERIELWKEADRLVRVADALLQRNNYDQAIERCQDALRLDPAHMDALERLGELYFAKELYVEAVNAYIRLVSVDPSRGDIQRRLIEALDAYGDHQAVRYMAEWYLEENTSDDEVVRHLANALYAEGEFVEAAEAYGRVMAGGKKDVQALEMQAAAYMQVKEYNQALVPLSSLHDFNYRKQGYYKQLAVCYAQLLDGPETVQTLGRAAQLFGQKIVMGWMQDPLLDPVREDRSFQAFADRIGGEEFRLWLEKMASAIDAADEKQPVAPMLEIKGQNALQQDLLKPKQ
ncbi:tetratricopeptide repeat protein [Pontiella sulfatireligans]|uniref:Uncharacterized protein n=1 Tax=Pontiella sulfatireligans TaxID=2750658 RepID=A0A6C2UPJ9_9BACT|nr:tetratricopeptide repeat protein [Pontiella sulfatireligans]VGO21247.1 hypothetical protein SCARR_03319 [Pontiella sulfatireligans]